MNGITAFQPYDNTANISATHTLGVDNALFNMAITGGSLHVELRDFLVGTGEQLRMAMVAPGNGRKVNATQINLDSFSWGFSATSNYNSSQVNIASNLPATSQLEFVRDFVTTNNCFISYEESTKTVRLDTFNSYFLPNAFAYDITNKVDTNNGDIKISPPDLPANIYLKYTNDDSDALIKQDLEYGNLQISNKDNIYSNNDSAIDCIYSATRLRNFTFMDFGVNANLPTIMSEEDVQVTNTQLVDWKFNSAPRILKLDDYLKDNSGNTLYLLIDGYPTPILLSMFEDNRNDKLSLRFDTENGLYTRYFERYLNSIADSHIIELDSRINSYDYTQMQANVPIKVQNLHYFLGKIDAFKPANDGRTKIQLIRKLTN